MLSVVLSFALLLFNLEFNAFRLFGNVVMRGIAGFLVVQLAMARQMVAQGYPPPRQQHVNPGYEHLYCQCGCGVPIDAVGSMHAAAGAQQQPHRHHSQHHQSTFTGGSGAGLLHHHVYATPYSAQHEMVRIQWCV